MTATTLNSLHVQFRYSIIIYIYIVSGIMVGGCYIVANDVCIFFLLIKNMGSGNKTACMFTSNLNGL